MRMTMASNSAKRERVIKRVLIALNSCSNEQDAIEAAVELARQLEAELAGLFVEDLNLLHLAELPFAHEILGTHLQKRLFDVAQLQRSMAAQAARVRQALMSRAERRSVSWRFLRTQGRLVAETAAATEGMDLLVIGRECQGAIMGDAPADVAGEIVRQSRCSVLIAARQQSPRYREINILVDNSSNAISAVQSGIMLAQMEELPLRLLLLASDAAMAAALKEACCSRVAGVQSGVTFEVLPGITGVASRLSSAQPLLLVLGYDSLGTDEALLKQLLHALSGPILIVR